MKISQLSDETGVARATLKYYLREGLLHAGASRGRTQADYDASHVARVRLVRALIEAGGLSLASVKEVVQALESPPDRRHDLLGAAQCALTGSTRAEPVSCPRARALMNDLSWRIDPGSPLLTDLEHQLDAADAAGVAVPDERLRTYATSMHEVAQVDVESVPDDPQGAVRQVVVATVLIDPILITLRRLGQQDVSAQRFGLD
ncbi:MerR family transcriptional regulator [Leekyejoonella antrihumi]|uniref:MerR family transcriptional regulator n=1 Tax=Leekyejoonella antrihumi TaxID=1660198 RepID=A0A563DZK4_9MICO|nr:MerR family transcriptional regulator [Leekyejoonella antrihumi]TWP35698.1 MerR family transcriptional regulator [Leekyejoonella antrihumi]